jgi:hypothetical protein
MPNTGAASRPSITSAAPSASHGRLTTPPVQRDQKRLAVASLRIRGRSIRGPTAARIAGVRVIVASVLMSGMRMPPTPIERRKGTLSAVSDNRPIATAAPEKTTEWPACSTAIITALWLSRPWSRSSRQRVTTSSE